MVNSEDGGFCCKQWLIHYLFLGKLRQKCYYVNRINVLYFVEFAFLIKLTGPYKPA